MRLEHQEISAPLSSNAMVSASVREYSDAAAGTSTQYRISAGDMFQGSLSSYGDEDWVAVTLTAGETYVLTMTGAASGGGTLYDPYLQLRSANGAPIQEDDDSGVGYESAMVYTADRTGTYYINASAYDPSQTGSYTVTVSAFEPAHTGTLDDLAEYLTDGFWEDSSETPRRFDTSGNNVITVNLTGLTAEGKQLARWAFDAWEMVADIQFRETTNAADITFDDNRDGAFSVSDVSNGYITSSTVNVSIAWLAGSGTSIDSYSFQTYMHEIGHALGLGHQGDYNGSAFYSIDEGFSNDSWQLSVMSYFSQLDNFTVDASYAYLLTPMMADVIAIQELYGAPGSSSATAGDTIWGPDSSLPGVLGDLFGNQANYEGEPVAFTICDQGGTDTLDLSGFDTASRADLRQEHFSDAGGLIGNVGIARGTVVENLVTGAGNDTVTGNNAANDIRTQAGDDTIRAMGGNDRLFGGNGNDQMFGNTGSDHLDGGAGRDRLVGGGGSDRLFGGGQIDRLNGGSADDRLYGGAGRDRLDGGSGRDLLNGGAGDDILIGGTGNDVFVFGGTHGHDRILDFTAGQGADRINVSRLTGFDDFGDVLADAVQTADGVRITTSANSSVLLEDVQLNSLSADDFIF